MIAWQEYNSIFPLCRTVDGQPAGYFQWWGSTLAHSMSKQAAAREGPRPPDEPAQPASAPCGAFRISGFQGKISVKFL
jgi:hypothetical protein